MSLIQLFLFKLDKHQLKIVEPQNDMPTGIACPVSWIDEIHVDVTKGKPGRHPAWCTNPDCSWKGWV